LQVFVNLSTVEEASLGGKMSFPASGILIMDGPPTEWVIEPCGGWGSCKEIANSFGP